jgi:hypothetical protein
MERSLSFYLDDCVLLQKDFYRSASIERAGMERSLSFYL